MKKSKLIRRLKADIKRRDRIIYSMEDELLAARVVLSPDNDPVPLLKVRVAILCNRIIRENRFLRDALSRIGYTDADHF